MFLRCQSLSSCCMPTTDKDLLPITEPISRQRYLNEERSHHSTQPVLPQKKEKINAIGEQHRYEIATLQRELNEARRTIRLLEERLLAYSHSMIPTPFTQYPCMNAPGFTVNLCIAEGRDRRPYRQVNKEWSKKQDAILPEESEKVDACEYVDVMDVVARGRGKNNFDS